MSGGDLSSNEGRAHETLDDDAAETVCRGTDDRLRAFDDYGFNVEELADGGDGPG